MPPATHDRVSLKTYKYLHKMNSIKTCLGCQVARMWVQTFTTVHYSDIHLQPVLYFCHLSSVKKGPTHFLNICRALEENLKINYTPFFTVNLYVCVIQCRYTCMALVRLQFKRLRLLLRCPEIQIQIKLIFKNILHAVTGFLKCFYVFTHHIFKFGQNTEILTTAKTHSLEVHLSLG